MNTKWIIGIIAAIAIIGGGAIISNDQTSNDDSVMEKKQAMEKKVEVMEKTETKMAPKTEGVLPVKDEKMMGEEKMAPKGAYVDYSPSALASATKDGGKAVLYFYAPWCPFCKVADAAFTSKTSDIPAGVTVLKTSYDNEKDLKTKYGVTYQHTFVQVDAQGNQIAKWNGGDIDALKANINKNNS